MELKDFTYRNTPVKKTRVYEVHTLSQDGLNLYLDKNSYVHKFLKNLSPTRTRMNFHPEINHYPSDKSLQNKAQHKDLNISMKGSKDFNSGKSQEKGSVITINLNNFHKNMYYRPICESMDFEKNEKLENSETYNNMNNNNFGNCNNNSAIIELDENVKLNEEIDRINEENQKKIEEKKSVEFCSKPKNKKNTFLQTSKHVFFNQNKYTQNQNYFRRFNSQKYSQDYNDAISNLKEKFNENMSNFHTTKSPISPDKSNLGCFKSYEVPHLEYKRLSSNFRINMIRDKLENMFLKNGKNTNVDPKNNEDLETISKKIEIENLKLKNYFSNINKFSKSDDHGLYPSVSEITNSNNLRTTKLRLLNNKYMGERYDPTNFA